MFDATELPTVGMITATLRHPRTGDQFDVDFYVTEREHPILGIEACRCLDMLRIVEENICETHESTSSEAMTSADIFTRYADLFDGSLGCMEGEFHLAVDPRFHQMTSWRPRVTTMQIFLHYYSAVERKGYVSTEISCN